MARWMLSAAASARGAGPSAAVVMGVMDPFPCCRGRAGCGEATGADRGTAGARGTRGTALVALAAYSR